MNDDLTLTTVLPLRMVLFQTILLLVAIILEAMVLRQRLRLPKQVSLERSASINLLTVSVGWILFFFFEPLLPAELKEQLVSLVFFDRIFANGWSANMPIWIVVTGIVAFFITFFIKLQGLELLMLMMGEKQKEEQVKLPAPEGHTSQRTSKRLKNQQFSLRYQKARDRANAVLRANAVSFSAVLLLLLLRIGLQTLTL
jgi:hypothetical protein